MKTRRRMRHRRRSRGPSGRRPRLLDSRSLQVEPLEVRALLDGFGVLGGQAPVAQDDAYTGDEDVPLLVLAADGVLDNDSDAEGDLLTASLVSGPSNGTVSLQIDGSFLYTPNQDYNGPDSFTYVANDGASDSNVATVSLTVNAVNDAPVAADEAFTTDEDVMLYVPVANTILGNDSDVDGDPLTAVKATDPQNGTLNLGLDGSFYYTPNQDFNGTDSFTYTANDGTEDSAPATVTITVNSIEDAPIAVDDFYTVDENTTLTTTDVDGQGTPTDPNDDGVLANDTDAEGDPLTAWLVTDVSSGTLTLRRDGTFTYTPNQFFNGTDTFTYRANDGDDDSNVATVTITVGPVDNPPVTQPDFYTVAEDGTLNVLAGNGVLSNDFEPDGQPMEAFVDTGPSNGQLTFQIDGSFVYTPDTDFVGTDTFTYIATDDTPNSSPPTLVTIDVTNTNDAPDAIADHYRINTNARLEVPNERGVLVNDFDLDNDPLTAVLDTGPSNARYFQLSADGSFIYWPEPGFHGNDTFTYMANDGQADSTPDTVTVGVGGPIAGDDEYFIDVDTTLSALPAEGVLVNDRVLVGSTMTAVQVTDPSHGTVALAADGSLVFQPDPGFVGEDSFLYVANDGVADSNAARVSITVGGPKALDDTYHVDENEVLVVGPVDPPPELPMYTFTPGNLLVTNTDEFGVSSLHEVTLDGTVVQSIQLDIVAGPARDFDIAANGEIHIYAGGLPDPITGEEMWSVFTLDPATGATQETPLEDFVNPGPERYYSGAATYGDYLFLTDYSEAGDPEPRGGLRFDLGRAQIYGASSYDGLTSGGAMAVGDLNGDGIDDVILGAPGADGPNDARNAAGEAYVYFGGSNLAGTKDVAGLSGATPDLVIYGASAWDALTSDGAVAVGDVNGDGIDDLILGARDANGPGDARYGAGEAYVIFGSKGLGGTIDLAAGDEGLVVYGASFGDSLTDGGALTAGDVNGDGIDDLILGARDADGPGDARYGAGEAYVIFGSNGLGGAIDLGAGQGDVVIYGDSSGDHLTDGGALAVGDVNGDGTDDLILGAPFADGPSGGRFDAGEAYVVYGAGGLGGTIDLAAGDENVRIYGASDSDGLTSDGAIAVGDVNGDGIGDLILGAPYADGPYQSRFGAGEAYVVYGSGTLGGTTIDLAAGDGNVRIYGASDGDELTSGGAIAVGDVNGDDIDDVILGAPYADGPADARYSAGEAYVIYGSATLGGTTLGGPIDLAVGAEDVVIYGATWFDHLTLGGALTVGDVNGDGIDDVILGAPNGAGPDEWRFDAGEAYVIRGSESLAASIDLDQGEESLLIYGASDGDYLTGDGALIVGDVNGDGIDDLILGAPDASGPNGTRTYAGEAYVIRGSETLGAAVIDSVIDLDVFGMVRFGEYINAIDVALGQDGMLYVLYNRLYEYPEPQRWEFVEGAEIEVYDPDTLRLDHKIVPSVPLRGIAVDDRGNIYATTAEIGIIQLDWQGDFQRQLIDDPFGLANLVQYGELADINLAENGQIVATFVSRDGLSGGGTLLVTDESFNSYSILPVFLTPAPGQPVGLPQDVTYAAFVPVPENPLEVGDNDVFDPATVPQYEVLQQPQHGTLVFRPWGGFEYAPEAGFVGTDTFTYQFSDGTLNSNPATVTIVVDPTPLAPRAPFYFTVPEAAVLPGNLLVQNEDIVGFDGSSYFLVFDGSDVGLADTEISAFCFLSPNEILLSVYPAILIPEMGENAGADDIVKFTASALGQTTAGRFDMYLDGSDVGLDPQLDNIDALDLLPDGTILISPSRWTNPPGVMGFDEDILSFFPVRLGRITAGNWEMYFDGSDVGMQFPTERIDALDVDPSGNIRFSTVDALNVAGVVADDEDVVVFEPTTLGHDTAGTFRSDLFFDGSAFGLAATDIDGLFIAVENQAPVLVGDTYAVNRNAIDAQHPYIVDGAGGVLSNDSDLATDPMIASLVEPTQFGSLVLGANGSFTYTPDDGFVGTDTFTYEVSDGLAVSATVTATIDVVDPDIRALGQSGAVRLLGQNPAAGDLWYSFVTANAGTMAVEALFTGGRDDVFVEIYDGINDLTPLVTSLPGGGGHRFEWTVDAPGESFLIRLSGINSDVELRIANAVEQIGDVVTVSGGDGDDLLVFDLNQPDHVFVNGVSQDLAPGSYTSIVFEGGPGDDRIELTGTPDSETAMVFPGSGTFDSTALDASFNDFEQVFIDGGGGGGIDVVHMYDSDGNDTYQAYSDHATLSGTTSAGVAYSFHVADFDYVHAYARNGISGGRDRAEFYDSPDHDQFLASADTEIAWMQALAPGTGERLYFNRAKFFEEVVAYSQNGGDDEAHLRDSKGNEQFVASPTVGTMVGITKDGAAFTFQAEGFRYLHAYGLLGGYDTASLTGTLGSDEFKTIANATVPYSFLTDWQTYFLRAKKMDVVVANGNGGEDTASFKDSAGDDTMIARPEWVKFLGPGYYSRIYNFSVVSALGNYYAGDRDKAYWYDSPGDDTFTGTPVLSTLQGPGYTFSARRFQEVYVDAGNGGTNGAEIHDSALADVLEADEKGGSTWARLSSNNDEYDFLYELLAFDTVKAHAGPEDTVPPEPLPPWLTIE